jgi:hypothetical protein
MTWKIGDEGTGFVRLKRNEKRSWKGKNNGRENANIEAVKKQTYYRIPDLSRYISVAGTL